VHDIDKGSLRRRLVAGRAAMSDSIRNEAGRLIRDHVLEMPEVAAAGTIAAYYSVGTEPDTRSLVFALWKRGSYVVLPVLLPDGDLDWASYEGPDSLAPGPRGLLQPAEPVRGTGTVARPWTHAASGSAGAADRTTGPWTGWGRGSRRSPCCMTRSCCRRSRRRNTTGRSARWRGPGTGSRGCPLKGSA
jgi:5-formyltetrahydrofolate cyclo-ligase